MNAENFAARVVAVGGGALRIVSFPSRPLILRAVTTGVVDERVIASRGIQIAGGVEAQPAARMIGLFRQRRNAEQDFLGVQSEDFIIHSKARDTIFEDARFGVEEVEPMICQVTR